MKKEPDSYEVIKKSTIKRLSALQVVAGIAVAVGLIYVVFQVTMLSKKVAALSISDEKMEFVHGKVTELVKILDSKDDMTVDYEARQQYEFLGNAAELTVTEPLSAQENREALKEELSRMKAGDKLKVVRDRLVDVYQRSKLRDEELIKLKQSFYEVSVLAQNWYNDKKGIKQEALEKAHNPDVFERLKQNLSHFVQVNKVAGQNTRSGQKVLTIDKIPQLLGHAEILLEAGSLSQAAWVMEDIQTITGQEELVDFSARVQIYLQKFPNPNYEILQIKELIDIIENKE